MLPLATPMMLRRLSTSSVVVINSASVGGDHTGSAQAGFFRNVMNTVPHVSLVSRTGRFDSGRQSASGGGPCESAGTACRCTSMTGIGARWPLTTAADAARTEAMMAAAGAIRALRIKASTSSQITEPRVVAARLHARKPDAERIQRDDHADPDRVHDRQRISPTRRRCERI